MAVLIPGDYNNTFDGTSGDSGDCADESELRAQKNPAGFRRRLQSPGL